MKVLLMTSFSGIGFNFAPPIGLYRLKQFIEEVGVECNILDFGLGGYEEALAKAKQGEYQVIGMSVSSYHMRDDLKIIWELKDAAAGQKCVFIVGGQEATHNYKNWLIGGADLVFLGFGERTIAAFCDQLQHDFDGTMANLSQFEGIAYREAGEFIFRKSKELTPEEFRYLNYEKILTLDIPFKPYWEHVKSDSDDLNFWTTKFVAENVRIYTTSHCPYSCSFCSSSSFLTFSQEKKMQLIMLTGQEIFNLIMRYIEKDKARGFLFSDDEFLLHRYRVHDLCGLIIDAKNKGFVDKEVMFNCQNRINDFFIRLKEGGVRIDEKLIEKMASAGFHSIGLGVETFVDRLLVSPSMNKKGYTEKESLVVLETLLAKGLIPQINQIIFIPEATREEILYSIKRIISFIRRGCQVAVTPLMHAPDGAPAVKILQDSIIKEKFVNKQTGEVVEIKRTLIPHDPHLAERSARIWEVFDEEVRMAKKDDGFHKIPKTLVAVLMYISVTRLLEDNDSIDDCVKLKRELIDYCKHGKLVDFCA